MDRAHKLHRASARLKLLAAEQLAEQRAPVEKPTEALVDSRADLKHLGDQLLHEHLRSLYWRFRIAIDSPTRDQAAINRLREELPRPIGDHDFWDLVLQTGRRFRRT